MDSREAVYMKGHQNTANENSKESCERIRKLCSLIREDMQPALGVTEPAAIALAAAYARSLTKEEIQEIRVCLNSGIYKNAYTCGIPGTSDVGNEFSAALGAVAGKAELGLLVLRDVNEEAVRKARILVQEGKVHAELDSISSVILIRAEIKTAHDTCIAEIRETHSGLVLLQKNGEVVFQKESLKERPVNEGSTVEGSEVPDLITLYQLSDIFRFADETPFEELQFMKAAYEMNLELAASGASWKRCVLTAQLLRQNGGGFYSEDVRQSAKTLALAAAEARVLGIDQPAMSITGSGTHGIICTLPLYAFCKVQGISEELLLRATAVSYLICMYIKSYSGKLSAFCGCGIAGGTGLACALAYLMGGNEETMESAAMNMAASITGMICTGGNHCCCLKVMSAVDSAFNAAELAVHGVSVKAPHGILDASVEQTLKNVGLIADPGMTETERVIVQIINGV